MRAVVQRVQRAEVRVAGERVGAIGPGLLALVGVGRDDDLESAELLASKLVQMRVFPDEGGKMNRSLLESGGELVLVSQFTLYGDLRKGLRPSFGASAPAPVAAPLFDALVGAARRAGVRVETGRFGAEMEVELVGAGPVTLLVDTQRTF